MALPERPCNDDPIGSLALAGAAYRVHARAAAGRARTKVTRLPGPKPAEPQVAGILAGRIKELKRLAVELDTTQQALIAECINLVLAKYAKPTVAT
jgi:hypothetical protein